MKKEIPFFTIKTKTTRRNKKLSGVNLYIFFRWTILLLNIFPVSRIFWRENWIFYFYKNFFDEYKKRYCYCEEIVNSKSVDLFEINYFVS